MAIVYLKDGSESLIDDEDLELVSQYKWYNRHGYAYTTFHRKGCTRTDKDRNVNVSMHRLIMNAEPTDTIDHIDRNRLNNRKCNLRKVSRSLNIVNGARRKSKGKYIGVSKCRGTENTYVARFGQQIIGYYHGEENAGKGRDLFVIEKFGTNELPLNFPVAELPPHVEPLPPKPNAGRTSKYKGVSYARNRKAKAKWRAVYKTKHLGWFMTEEQAVSKIKEYENESC